MEPWQAELIGRIAVAVDDHRAGSLSLRKLVEDSRGLFDAADISDNIIRSEFLVVWAPVDGELELRTEDWSRPEWVSDECLETVLDDLRNWALQRSTGSVTQ
ncbi:MAG TPA: hypothetical protein VMR89_00860 [Actinomycetota bacterium]|nr:hypothetical protein [Actinomycetota bacterium]